uniref:Uncharacterized protein n=1 Tax=Nelumbo nucifera TaxID=4432 RepID=A0A822Y9R1_NELNU|nr:TPA_asm: hypothetical protein HUJ06_029769 [Nelumbo nucifera]
MPLICPKVITCLMCELQSQGSDCSKWENVFDNISVPRHAFQKNKAGFKQFRLLAWMLASIRHYAFEMLSIQTVTVCNAFCNVITFERHAFGL